MTRNFGKLLESASRRHGDGHAIGLQERKGSVPQPVRAPSRVNFHPLDLPVHHLCALWLLKQQPIVPSTKQMKMRAWPMKGKSDNRQGIPRNMHSIGQDERLTCLCAAAS